MLKDGNNLFSLQKMKNVGLDTKRDCIVLLMKSLVTILVILALVSVSILSSSCATAVGVGKDLQSFGQALENAAR